MTLVDYSANFWGDKHIGYHVLYENLKKGEDTIQEFSNFVKERMGVEDDLLKFLHKSISRVNNYVTSSGAFVDSWRLTKGTLELWADIQTSLLKNLSDLSKDVIKYHDDLVKSRKRAREYDVLDAVNLMQTTTTCLQKAKETYHQRCTEAMNLKNEASSTKEFLKAKNKLTKAHDEYRAYVEKYNQVRDNFEEKMYKSTAVFQNHDSAHLQQIKNFFVIYASALDDAHLSVSQTLTDYRRKLESIDITELMHRFVMEKGTGAERPQPLVWTESDEIPAELEAYALSLTTPGGPIAASAISAPSSSNSSAIVAGILPTAEPPSVNDLLGINDAWPPAIRTIAASEPKSGDSESDDGEDLNGSTATASTTSHSYVPQFSSWFGRQKLTQWRKKHSASQSNLPAATAASTSTSATPAADTSAEPFSSSYNNDSGITGMVNSAQKGANFLKRRYRKSINDLTLTNKDFAEGDAKNEPIGILSSGEKTPSNVATSVPNSTNLFDFINDWNTITNSSERPLPPPIPNSDPPLLLTRQQRRISIASSDMTTKKIVATGLDCSMNATGATDLLNVASRSVGADETSLFGATDWSSTTGGSGANSTTGNSKRHSTSKDPWAADSDASSSSSDSLDEDEFQASKFRTLQIKPLDKTFASDEKMNASVEELRNVVKHMTLQRSTTFDKDSWAADADNSFSHSLNAPPKPKPLRATLTGDDHLRRKFSDMDTVMLSPTNFDFTQFGTSNSIARARVRSHTPTAAQLMQIQSGSGNSSSTTSVHDSANSFNVSQASTGGFAAAGSLSNVFDANRIASTSSPLNFGVTPFAPARPSVFTNGVTAVTQQLQQKLPIAMALNEYVHVWFTRDKKTPAMRIFGTVMISLPTSILPFLLDQRYEVGSVRFCLRNTAQIKSILPNQKLIEATSLLDPRASSYSFKIERSTLAQWLAVQQQGKPTSTFHNVDIVRYELEENSGGDTFTPPLRFTAYWRCDAAHTDLRVDYALNADSGLAVMNPLLNIQFNTVVDGSVESVQSEPEAQWTLNKTWTKDKYARFSCSSSN